jgi:hypothetical protein
LWTRWWILILWRHGFSKIRFTYRTSIKYFSHPLFNEDHLMGWPYQCVHLSVLPSAMVKSVVRKHCWAAVGSSDCQFWNIVLHKN